MTRCAVIETTEGSFVAEFSSRGLKRLEFPGKKAVRKSNATQQAPMDPRQQRWLQLTESALGDVMAGRKPRALPPMDWEEALRSNKMCGEPSCGSLPAKRRLMPPSEKF